MSEKTLGAIIYRVAKFAVSLLEKEYGMGKGKTARVTEVNVVGPQGRDRILVVDRLSNL